MCLRGHCGFKWSPKKQDAIWTLEERAEFTAKQAQVEAEWSEATEARIAELSEKIMQEKAYDRYHFEALGNQRFLDYIAERGIPMEWAIFWKMGVIEDYKVTGHLSTYRSLAYTIPIISEMCRIENIKIRVADPKDGNDRYRNYYKSGCQHLYNPLNKPLPAHGHAAVIMEGEYKSDTGVMIGGLDQEKYHIFGAQSKQPEERLLKKLECFDVVYLAFDPDAYVRTKYYDATTGEEKRGNIAVLESVKHIGAGRARLVIPPRGMKFDDAMQQGFNFRNAVNMAIKPERLTE